MTHLYYQQRSRLATTFETIMLYRLHIFPTLRTSRLAVQRHEQFEFFINQEWNQTSDNSNTSFDSFASLPDFIILLLIQCHPKPNQIAWTQSHLEISLFIQWTVINARTHLPLSKTSFTTTTLAHTRVRNQAADTKATLFLQPFHTVHLHAQITHTLQRYLIF